MTPEQLDNLTLPCPVTLRGVLRSRADDRRHGTVEIPASTSWTRCSIIGGGRRDAVTQLLIVLTEDIQLPPEVTP